MLGHNNPPTDAEQLRQWLATENEKLLSRAKELAEAVERMPAEITDDETAGKATDIIKMINGARSALETARKDRKKPFLDGGRMVDSFFDDPMAKLDLAKAKANKPLEQWIKKKADEERRRRELEAAELRAKAEAEAITAEKLADVGLHEHAAVSLDKAVKADVQAQTLETARPAQLAAARGAGGGYASLRTRWVGEIENVAQLDLQLLRPYLPLAALQQALNSFVSNGGRQCPGAKIYEKSDVAVR